MTLAPQIIFRHLVPTRSVEKRIEAEIASLAQVSDRLHSCRVMVAPAGEERESGNQYHVRVDLGLPGRQLVVGREPGDEKSHEDLHAAIRDAFAAARRQLEDYTGVLRGDVKQHTVDERHGEVARLMPGEGFGFVRAQDGHEVYFHKNSVSRDRFEDLHVGSWVAFTEEDGRDGPQAARLHLDRGLRPPSDALPGTSTSQAPRS